MSTTSEFSALRIPELPVLKMTAQHLHKWSNKGIISDVLKLIDDNELCKHKEQKSVAKNSIHNSECQHDKTAPEI